MKSERRDGYAMVAVLIFCLILIPVIAAFAQSAKMSARSTNSSLQASKIAFLLDGLSDVAATKLASDRGFAMELVGGIQCGSDRVQVSMSFQDHDGKIDLNNGATELLRAGFEAAGLTAEQATLLQQYVESSRSGRPLPREISGVPEGLALKGAPFERVEEINDLAAALSLHPRNLSDYFTVYKRRGGLELASANEKLRTLVEERTDIEGLSKNDNGGAEYIDLRLEAHSTGRAYNLVKTYQAIVSTGEVRLLARKRNPMDFARIEVKHKYQNCIDILRRPAS